MMGRAGATREVPGGDSGPEGAGTWAGGGLSLQGNHWNYSWCYCEDVCTAFLGYFSLPYPPALGRLNQPGTCDDQVAGVVTQGDDFRHGRVAAFFSAKLTSAQMNYPVHEIEMLAGVEAMRRHRDVLLGCSFTWVTDHKGLIHLLNQRNLSGRQA